MKNSFFKLASKMSLHSDYETHQLGAIITRKNKIIGVGFNKKRTHPMSTTRFQNIHAELAAILNSKGEDFSGCDIYVYRATKNGNLAMSKPCKDCEHLIRNLGFKRVFYTEENGYKEMVL